MVMEDAVPQPRQYVNLGEEDEMAIVGYRPNTFKMVLLLICSVICPVLILVFYWKPNWLARAALESTSLGQATYVLLKDQYNQEFVEKVHIVNKDGSRVSPSYDRHISYSQNSLDKDIPCHVLVDGCIQDGKMIKYFANKKLKYIYSVESAQFTKLKGLDTNKDCAYFHTTPNLTALEAIERAILYGNNKLEVHVTSVIKLIWQQITNPFYIFQVASCTLWLTDDYYYYAGAIFFISTVSITITTISTRQMQRALKMTVHQFGSATVRRGDQTLVVLPTALVPGDIIEIPQTGLIMDVDAVLLTGNCIVNEAMLTGESIPITKTPLPNPKGKIQPFSIKADSKHVLFCGTQVIQTRYYGDQAVTAMVLRTGFMTAKGELLRSIMFPKPVDFKFYRDTYKFVGALAGCALVGMCYTIYILIMSYNPADLIIRRVLDLITITVPPALPAALAVGVVIGQQRLKRKKIFCIQSSYINIAGSINVVCFDKTGTLTEEGLDMRGAIPCNSQRFAELITDVKSMPDDSNIKAAMATCHSLTYINGCLSGDPLDQKMFESTGWMLEEPGVQDSSKYDIIMPTVVKSLPRSEHQVEIGILRQFTFSSSLMRMSVIVKNLSSPNFELYVKGSPEMIASLCLPETVPSDFSSRLAEYTQKGYRVIGLAHRVIQQKYTKIQRVDRSEVETNLTFIGLLVLENRLKIETTPVIKELDDANIKTIMVTGDNILTAISVARECGIIKPNEKTVLVSAMEAEQGSSLQFHYSETGEGNATEQSLMMQKQDEFLIDVAGSFKFAVTGQVWGLIKRDHPDVLQKIAVKGGVFARMAPEQKAQLIETLQDTGYYVAMCGDGANDCGALKAAHTGISLSEAEASVASPFTSKNQNIECVPLLIKEGRAALVTSFGIFKYIAGYSLTQFASVLILYWIQANVTDFEFLFVDIVMITSISITFGHTEAADKLYKRGPAVHLASFLPIFILVFNFVVMTAGQVGGLLLVQNMDGFVEYSGNFSSHSFASFENTAVFDVSMFQYIALAIMFSKGHPYRKAFYTNLYFMVNLFIVFGLAVWLTVWPTGSVEDFFEFRMPENVHIRLALVGIGCANIAVSILMEQLVTGNETVRMNVEKIGENCSRDAAAKYKIIEDEISASPSWPPLQNSPNVFGAIVAHEINAQSRAAENKSSADLTNLEPQKHAEQRMISSEPNIKDYGTIPAKLSSD